MVACPNRIHWGLMLKGFTKTTMAEHQLLWRNMSWLDHHGKFRTLRCCPALCFWEPRFPYTNPSLLVSQSHVSAPQVDSCPDEHRHPRPPPSSQHLLHTALFGLMMATLTIHRRPLALFVLKLGEVDIASLFPFVFFFSVTWQRDCFVLSYLGRSVCSS